VGPVGQRTPHVSETEQSNDVGSTRERRSSPTAGLPAVTSTPGVLLDIAHTTIYLVGLLVGASNGGGAHGGAVVRDDGATPVEATAKSSDALYRTTETLRRWLHDQDG